MKEILYIVEDNVISGKRIGRTLGFPTANLPYPENCSLEKGVYAATLQITDRKEEYISAVNIGTHPSFPEGLPTIEAYVLDHDIDLYGKHIRILFYKKIRDEIHFLKKEDLISQIDADIVEIRSYFSSAINEISRLS